MNLGLLAESKIEPRMIEHKGWYSRRNLPHFDGGNTNQFITFRLADSLPVGVLEQLEEDLKTFKGDAEIEKIRGIEKLIDQGSGSCILRHSACAEIVRSSLEFLDGERFDLHAWVLMPNHVHFLARFNEGQLLPDGLHSLKSYTANEIKKIYPEMGSVWQPGYFDRYMRSEEHFWRKINYIHQNPVNAKLCAEPHEFQWSSAALVRE